MTPSSELKQVRLAVPEPFHDETLQPGFTAASSGGSSEYINGAARGHGVNVNPDNEEQEGVNPMTPSILNQNQNHESKR